MEAKENLWRSNRVGENIRRHKLRDLLPMEEPISIDIEASSICCLKCRYCPQSLDTNKKKNINIANNGLMEMSLFNLIIDQIKDFSHPLKNIRFAGFGEPLLNSNIVKMVKTIKREHIADTITIFSNGIPLNKDISDELAENVDTFLFDIQGTCADDYKKWCNTIIDYEKLIYNIKYLYEKKNRGRIFCKTFKSIVKGKEDEFKHLFRSVCDEIGIEDLYEIYPEIDYSGMIIKEKTSSIFNMCQSDYCAYPWYQMAIDADGRVTACTLPISKNSAFLTIGNVKKGRLIDMWNGNKLNKIRYDLLCKRETINECRSCKYTDLTPQEDRIDEIRDTLICFCQGKME